MNPYVSFLTRRGLLRGGLALGAVALFTPGVFAEELARTPRLTEGPFYPDSCRSTPTTTCSSSTTRSRRPSARSPT